jgi:hypothetical protein
MQWGLMQFVLSKDGVTCKPVPRFNNEFAYGKHPKSYQDACIYYDFQTIFEGIWQRGMRCPNLRKKKL